MIRHYLLVTLRQLRRHSGYTVINIAGLSLGVACAVITLLYVSSELSFDRMHAAAERTYRVEMIMPQNGRPERWSASFMAIGEEIRSRYPGVESVARVRRPDQPLVVRTGTDTRSYEDDVVTTEPSFFRIFDFPIAEGNADALSQPNTAFLSRAAANRYFGDEDPIGQSISVYGKWDAGSTDYQIAGIIDDMPHNVHFRADIILSLRTDLTNPASLWGGIGYTYVSFPAPVDMDDMARRFTADLAPVLAQNRFEGVELALMPLTRIHLHGLASSDVVPQGDIRYLYLFSAIAVLVLLIACINYTNLATAKAAHRAKEVGVRKSVGAGRRELIAQFLLESVVLACFAVALAAVVVQLALPAFNAVTGRELVMDWSRGWLIGALVAGAVTVGLLAGAYPAFALSMFRPVAVLKGRVQVSTLPALRKSLTVFQFAVSIGLVICTVVIHRQLDYVQHSRLGFDKEQVLVVRTRTALPEASAESFRHALASQPGVSGVARAQGIPGEPTSISFYSEDELEGFEGTPPIFDHFWVGPDFASILGLEMASGRFFDAARPTDEHDAIIVNEATVRALGWEDPLGKRIGTGEDARTVIGVVRDFHYRDMRSEIQPVVMELSSGARRYYAVKFNTTAVASLLDGIEATWTRFIPDHPFDYSFLDGDFAAMYRAESRLGRLFVAFAILAISIACLGLVGLTAFMTQLRTKEIGIRKVLGASGRSLMILMSKELVVLVGVAFVIAGPPAYLAMRQWLENFVYHTPIQWEVFAVAGAAALVAALGSVAFHLITAARANPVESLQCE